MHNSYSKFVVASHNNMRITRLTSGSLSMMRSHIDAIVNALGEYTHNPGRPLHTNAFHKCGHTSDPKMS